MDYINLSEIVQFSKAPIILISVHLKISTLCVVSHVLSVKVSPEWKSNPGFGTQKTCPFPLNRVVPSTEETDSKIMWTFFRDQILCPLEWRCPLNRRVRERMSQRRGSTVFRKGKGTHHSFPMPINICSLVLSIFDESNWLKVPPQFFFLHILMLFLMKGTY